MLLLIIHIINLLDVYITIGYGKFSKAWLAKNLVLIGKRGVVESSIQNKVASSYPPFSFCAQDAGKNTQEDNRCQNAAQSSYMYNISFALLILKIDIFYSQHNMRYNTYVYIAISKSAHPIDTCLHVDTKNVSIFETARASRGKQQ